MSGEANLQRLLETLAPARLPGEFVFVTLPAATYGEHSELEPIASFVEAEGLTLVVPSALADARGHDVGAPFACITLKVHSSLEAVGLTAVVSRTLADRGISANVIAGYFHDHVFVPAGRADEAVELLRDLSLKLDG